MRCCEKSRKYRGRDIGPDRKKSADRIADRGWSTAWTRCPAWDGILRQPSAPEIAPLALAGEDLVALMAEATRPGVEIELMLAASPRQTAKAPAQRAQTRAEGAQSRTEGVNARAERGKETTHTLDSTRLQISSGQLIENRHRLHMSWETATVATRTRGGGWARAGVAQ